MARSAEQYKEAGNTCMKKLDFPGAIANYRSGLKLDSKNPILNCNLAQAYLNVREFVKAEKFAKAALRQQPNYVKGYYRAAKAAKERHDPYQSMMYLVQGVQNCDSEDLETLYFLAREFSQEFENVLRRYRMSGMQNESNFARFESGQSSKQDEQTKPGPENIKLGKAIIHNGPSLGAGIKVNEKLERDSRELDLEAKVEEKQNKLENKWEKQRKLLEQQECIKHKNDEVTAGMEQYGLNMEKKRKKINDLEQAKDVESKAHEKKEQEKKEAEWNLKLHEKEVKLKRKKLHVHLSGSSKLDKVSLKTEDKVQLKFQEKELKFKLTKLEDKNELEELTFMNKLEELKLMENELKEIKLKINGLEGFTLKNEWKMEQQLKMENFNKMHGEVQQNLKKDPEWNIKLKEEELLLKSKIKEARECLNIQLYNTMREGSLALVKGLSRKAVDNLKKVLDTISSHSSSELPQFCDEMDIIVLQFAFSYALILSNEYKNIVKAIEVLENIEKEGKHGKFPAVFLLLGRAYLRLNRFENAQPPLERGLLFLSRGTSFSHFSWPGTDKVIEFTDRNILQDVLEHERQICKLYHRPDAVCFSQKCLSISQHIIPSRNIFFSDPDFVGFVDILCEEHCHIYYHLSCWKDYKEHLSEVEKFCEKDFLGRECLTPDCTKTNSVIERAVIIKVTIIGPDGEEKSSCESIPALPLTSVQNKEKCGILLSPKRKPRKKDCDKNGRPNVKSLRKDLKTRGNSPSDAVPRRNVQGSQYKDGFSKLAVARENKFGYDSQNPDPYKVSPKYLKTPQLDKNEEFVYSYFHEIFKKEGFMSIFKLQEHWETSKELLPVLDPALITHTDLVKFLLDTENFAVVQDMIGIISELRTISAIVESKSEVLLPAVNGWQPSAATAFEASQTLSYTHASNGLEPDYEETYTKVGAVTQYFCGNTNNSSVCEDTQYFCGNTNNSSVCEDKGGSTNYYHEIDLKEDSKSDLLIEPGLVPISDSHDSNDQKHNESHQFISSNVPKKDFECDLSQSPNVTNDACSGNINISQPNSEKPEQYMPSTSKSLQKQVNPDHKHNESHQFISSNVPKKDFECDLSQSPNVTNDACSGNINISQPNSEKPEQYMPSTSKSLQKQVNPQGPERVEWKPRAKLLVWALETFPGESKVKLWEALTMVRAQNGYTLSGLPFDIIEEKVRSVLFKCADF